MRTEEPTEGPEVPGSPEPLKFDVNKAQEFLLKNPEFLIAMGILSFAVLAGKESTKPGYLKDMPPINPRTAGPWRGKGSFGHGFGPSKVTHK